MPPPITSRKRLAAILEVDPATLRRYLKRSDWPVDRAPPWSAADVEAVRRWRGTLQEDRAAGAHARGNPAPPDEQASPAPLEDLGAAYKKVQILLSRERMEHERLKRRLLAGELIERDRIDESLGGLADLFVQMFVELERTLPGRLASRTSAQIERDLGPLLDNYRNRILDRGDYELRTLAEARTRAARPTKQRRRGRPGAGGRRK